jgi:hypothetical protein
MGSGSEGAFAESMSTTEPTTQPKMAACAACHQVWSESMMIRVDNHLVCQLCKERALESKERYQMHSSFDLERLRNWGIVLTIVVVVGLLGFRMFIRSGGRMAVAGGSASSEAEPWAEKEPAQWPAMLLSNDLKVDAPQWTAARQAFLLQRKDLSVVGATVVTRAPSESTDAQPFSFSQWKLTHGNLPLLAMNKILPSAQPAMERGVLLAPVTVPAEFPVTALKLRPIGYGENMRMKILAAASPGGPVRVHSVSVRGNASSDETRIVTLEKNLLSGHERVVGITGDGSGTLLELDAPAPIEELVGAPVIDAFGHVAAIVTGPEHGVARNGVARRVKAFGMDALIQAVGP